MKVEETGMERFRKLQRQAKEIGIKGHHTASELEQLIKDNVVITEPIKESEKSASGITAEEAVKIDARLKYEEQMREKFRRERQIKISRATIIAKAKLLNIKIDLPENLTELQLAEARIKLGIKKKELKPSPETLGIEASKKGYYIFTNREQDDASHTVNLGGKYTIHLIPDQVHVLSAYHIKKWKQIATVPVYKRVPVSGPPVEGQMGEECRKVDSKPRFSFEYLGEAPPDAPFGLVLDTKILDKLKVEELV